MMARASTTAKPMKAVPIMAPRASGWRAVPLMTDAKIQATPRAGAIVAIGQGTYAFAPAAFGWLRTLSPAEGLPVFAAAALIQAAAIALFLVGRKS